MITSATREILQEEGADAALTALAGEVREARDSIRKLLLEDPERSWTIRELQDAAANGARATVMSIAFLQLHQAGELIVGDDLRVRAP
jgi:hypothetical protein